ncbi:hypothetical protein EVJ50_11210 [Synechococcus sp. RSCCF101]|nr:hypothetical protein EVJ50_11210 [Synechococcus sp. RSCCF101]
MTDEMNRKRSKALAELVHYEKDQLIHFRYHYEESAQIGAVDEIFELRSGNRGVELVHTVDFDQSTLPWWVKLLIGYLNRFGKAEGEGPLDGIAALLD